MFILSNLKFPASEVAGLHAHCFMVDDLLTECEMCKSARRVITELEGIRYYVLVVG